MRMQWGVKTEKRAFPTIIGFCVAFCGAAWLLVTAPNSANVVARASVQIRRGAGGRKNMIITRLIRKDWRQQRIADRKIKTEQLSEV